MGNNQTTNMPSQQPAQATVTKHTDTKSGATLPIGDLLNDLNDDFVQVGGAFVKHYYDEFDNDRGWQLAKYYKDVSLLSHDGYYSGGTDQVKGPVAIIERLQSLEDD